MIKIFCFTAAIGIFLAGAVFGEPAPPVPTEKDKCPVCGMFLAQYPAWTGSVVFAGGSAIFFDGPKDLLTWYNHIEKYSPGRTRADIAAVWVKDYYRLVAIDGRKALYVTGSDVLGPMGRELVPFEKESGASEFLKDHGGKKILRFGDITPEVLKSLE